MHAWETCAHFVQRSYEQELQHRRCCRMPRDDALLCAHGRARGTLHFKNPLGSEALDAQLQQTQWESMLLRSVQQL
eukprot:4886367-Karenia_brevis.AAC.1